MHYHHIGLSLILKSEVVIANNNVNCQCDPPFSLVSLAYSSQRHKPKQNSAISSLLVLGVARSKTYVCGCLYAETVGSNPTVGFYNNRK